MDRLAILGAGSWGTALAIVLAPRFREVRLWSHNRAQEINQTRENRSYLPGFPLPDSVGVSDDVPHAVEAADAVLLVTPSQHLREVVRRAAPLFTPDTLIVSATKGLEIRSLQRMSEVIREVCGDLTRVATLSGPTFAQEIASGQPAAVVIASPDSDLNRRIQTAFSGRSLRLYTNPDQVGVELGGALKNVIAIGAGICQGLGLGNNTIAALITRGLAEITRLAVAAGGQPQTLAGLAGLGDLVLTCTGDLSRNRRVGIDLGRGKSLASILASTSMVAEGVKTTYAAMALAECLGVELPITQQMFAVLCKDQPPRDAIRELMERSLKSE